MSLRYKISILAIITILIALVPLSLIHIRTLARAEEEEIQGKLKAIGKLVATELFTSELGAGSAARQYMFLKAAQSADSEILFAVIYTERREKGIAVLNETRFPNQTRGSEWDIIQRFVDQRSDPTVHYVSVTLLQGGELLMGYSIATIEQKRQQRQLQAVFWAAGLALLSVIGSIFFARWLTGPVRDLSMGMSRVAKGDLDIRLKHKTKDEIGTLTQSFNQMVADLKENVLERQRMGQELDIARHIQQKLLPQSEPKVPGLDTSGICLTYSEVGGDYYDYFRLNDGRLAIAIGDVSGHGVSSGLLAAAVQGCLRNQVDVNPDAGKVLLALDRAVRSSSEQMMTFCYAILDPNNRTATFAGAGHWSPARYIAQTGIVEEIYPSTTIAPALGSFLTKEYPEYHVSLENGDILAFYSDGILETIRSDREMYGENRFQEALKRCAEGSAQDIRDAILNEVKQFRGGMPQDDDIALVIVKIADVTR